MSEHPDVKPGDGFSVDGCSSCSRHLGSHIGKSGHFGDKDGGDDGDCDDGDCDDDYDGDDNKDNGIAQLFWNITSRNQVTYGIVVVN